MTGDEAARETATALADVLDGTRPFIEAASGLRADLERRGYSPTVAEGVAATWLTEAFRALWRRSSTTEGE